MSSWTEKTSPYMVAPHWFVEAKRAGEPENTLRDRVKAEIEAALRFQVERKGEEFGQRVIEEQWVDALYNLYSADYELHSTKIM